MRFGFSVLFYIGRSHFFIHNNVTKSSQVNFTHVRCRQVKSGSLKLGQGDSAQLNLEIKIKEWVAYNEDIECRKSSLF